MTRGIVGYPALIDFMRHRGFALTVLLALAVVPPARAQAPGPQGAEQGKYREQRWLIPTDDGSGRLMRTVVYRPMGESPRPLVVINHGASIAGPATAPQPRFAEASAWFVDQGYVVVVPQRRGYGETGGRQNESFGYCDNADFVGAGREGARDIAAAVAFMRQQPFVRAEGLVVAGHSAGGWATLAYASLNPPGVAAMINVAGGRGGRRDNLPNDNCSPEKLVQGAGTYGRTARTPTLWLYTANDSFFDAGLSRRMADAYRSAGGSATYRLLPAFGQDGHALFVARGSVTIWSPHVKPLLDRSP
ncbi:S9 family peptidase [Reyranella sp. CPCC 100927]|uniref:alpha/beta hydrolase family protein n=1 Tax=Reyranella sp. CPCC 100927 TaxID=2599616 RepID=UPI0015B39673|nr:alpha/beta hydrolase [Reyranella sp. CPCC 100927]